MSSRVAKPQVDHFVALRKLCSKTYFLKFNKNYINRYRGYKVVKNDKNQKVKNADHSWVTTKKITPRDSFDFHVSTEMCFFDSPRDSIWREAYGQEFFFADR